MSIELNIVALAQAIGTDVKALTAAQGALNTLSTAAQTSLVDAINELVVLIGGAGVPVDDLAGDGATNVTWSADKIFDSIEAAKTAVKDELLGGAGAALDTLNELATALGSDPDFATTVATALANRVRFDATQALDATQQAQARSNIGAISAADIGNFEHDYAADYAAAKA